MARIAPFAALRYDTNKAGKLDDLVAQPYDKIGKDLQQKYYKRSPHNVCRLIRSEEAFIDPATTYPQAAKNLREWIQQGILKQDEQPVYYIYYQIFKRGDEEMTRKGFIASVELEEDHVRAHERTLAGPKADRLRLLHALECNDELIFMLYSDPKHESVQIMDEVAESTAPLMVCKDDFGETHKIWALRDLDKIDKLEALLKPSDLFIADGHHRYETAVNFKNDCLKAGWKSGGTQGFDHRMMGLFPMEDPGLVIFPTHRLIKNVEKFSGPRLIASLMGHFDVTPMSSAEAVFAKMDATHNDQVFGLKALDTSDPFYVLQLKDPHFMDDLEELAGLSEASRNLGVTILHSLILNKELGIDAKALEAQTHVEYARSRDKAFDRVGEGGIQACFLLNSTSVMDVRKAAAAGERMPQKSTDFYPKLLAGLTMMELDIKK
jgi:uncharacterized protein (DUF1015 family)